MKFTTALKYIILSLQLLIFGCKCKNFDAINKVIESFSSNANEDPNKKEIITSFNSSSTAPPPVAITMQGNQKSPPPPKPKTACMNFQDDRINHGDLVVFVDAVNGKSDNSGESWEKAVNSINLALGIVVRNRAENLSKGNVVQEAFIAVAAGTYTHEHENKISSLGDGKEMIALYGYTDSILSNIIIAGGFLSGDKCSEVDKNDKYNPNGRKTIIDAEKKSSVLAIAEKGLTNIDIRDFTFINGAAKEVNAIAAKKDGGAISLRGEDLDNITFRNINIKNSTAENNGGAVAITGAGIGGVVFNDLVIDNSTANENGGGFYASSGDIELNSIKITDNKSKNGGGLYIMANASIIVAGKDNSISNNKISETNGAGIYINNNKNHSFDKLTVFQNTSAKPANLGAGVYLESIVPATPIVTFTNSTINGHKAQDGAGIYAVNTRIKLDGVILKNNIATKNGGGVYSLADVNIAAFTCEENNAKDGGCLYVNIINLPDLANRQKNNINMRVFNKNTASNFGGAIYALSAVRGLHDAAFIGNQSSNGGAIYANGNSMAVNLKNALFRKNTANIAGGAIYFAKRSQISTEIIPQDNKGNLEPSLAKISLLDSPQRINGTDAEGNTILETEENFLLTYKAIVSLFDNNTAKFAGGAIYANEDLSILNSSNNININKNYRKNHDKYGILTYNVDYNYDFPLTFDGNNSQSAGAIYATNFQQSGYGEYNNNTATLNGGAILTESINNELNGVYKNNSAENGAAIFAENLNSSINILEASNNTATKKGGALYFNNLIAEYIINGKFTANKANIASVLYLDNSNSKKLNIDGTYTDNTSAESPILVINNHTNMSLEVAGSYSQNNLNCIECLKHSEIAEFVDDLNAVTISGNFNGNAASTRSTEGGAFKFVNIVTLSISGRSNNYKTTENGGFLDVDKVTNLIVNNLNASNNQSHKNGGVIAVNETKNLVMQNDEKTISQLFEDIVLYELGLPNYETYISRQNSVNEANCEYNKSLLIEILQPLLDNITKDVNLLAGVIDLLENNKFTNFQDAKNAIVYTITNSIDVYVTNKLNQDINFINLDPAKQVIQINKAKKPYLNKLKDTARFVTDLTSMSAQFMSKYEAMMFYKYKALDNDPHDYIDARNNKHIISSNQANNGGFAYIGKVTNNAELKELILYKNKAVEQQLKDLDGNLVDKTVIGGDGGAVYINEIDKNLLVRESAFSDNQATRGAGLFVGKISNGMLVDNTRTNLLNGRTRYYTEYLDMDAYKSLAQPVSLSLIHFNIFDVLKPNALLASTVLINNNVAKQTPSPIINITSGSANGNGSGGFAYIGQIGTDLQIKNFVSANSSMVIDKLNGSVIEGVNNLILTTDAAKTSGVVINNNPASNINAVVIKP